MIPWAVIVVAPKLNNIFHAYAGLSAFVTELVPSYLGLERVSGTHKGVVVEGYDTGFKASMQDNTSPSSPCIYT